MEASYDLDVEAGKNNLKLLFDRELEYINDLTHLDDFVKTIRSAAVTFMEKHYHDDVFDAIVPYMAMCLFDKVISVEGKIPHLFPDVNDNSTMLSIVCLLFAWRMRTKEKAKRMDILQKLSLLIPKDCNLTDLEVTIRKIFDNCGLPNKRAKPLLPFIFLHFIEKYLPFKLTNASYHPMFKTIVLSKCDVQFTAFRPSVIGVSGLLVHAAHSLPDTYQSLKSQVMAIDVFAMEKDLIYSCSNMMEKLYKPASPPLQFPSTATDHRGPVQTKEIELAAWEDAWDQEEPILAVTNGDGSTLDENFAAQAHDYSAVSLDFPVGWSGTMKAGGADTNYESPADENCIIL